jgi:DNA-directed RNA polymerase subunit F
MEIISETPITFSEAKEILEKKRKNKMNYEQNNVLGHLSKFAKLSVKDVEKLKEELSKFSKLKEDQIIQICNFLPTNKDVLRAILYKDYNLFDDSELNKILEIVKKFL